MSILDSLKTRSTAPTRSADHVRKTEIAREAPKTAAPQQPRDRVELGPREEKKSGSIPDFSWLNPFGDDAPKTKEKPKVGDEPKAVKTGELDYYEQRAQDYEARHPGEEAPAYYREYGDKYVHKFEDLKDELSDEGDQWVDQTRKNLQDKLEAKRIEDPEGFARLEEDPEALKKFAFDTHSDAYLEAGLAQLPPEDLLKIATTPDLKDTLDGDALKETAQVISEAVKEDPSLLLKVPAEALKQLSGVIVDKLKELPAEIKEKLEGVADKLWPDDFPSLNPLDHWPL